MTKVLFGLMLLSTYRVQLNTIFFRQTTRTETVDYSRNLIDCLRLVASSAAWILCPFGRFSFKFRLFKIWLRERGARVSLFISPNLTSWYSILLLPSFLVDRGGAICFFSNKGPKLPASCTYLLQQYFWYFVDRSCLASSSWCVWRMVNVEECIRS